MAIIESWFRQDLKEPVHVQMIQGNVFSQDEQANLIGVVVTDGGETAALSGSVAASIIRADGATVAQAGTLSGNKCSVILPAAAYAVPGPLVVALKLTQNGVVTTVLAVAATVYRTSTDTVVDPGTIIPSIQDLIEEIEEVVATIPQDYSALSDEVTNEFNYIIKSFSDYSNYSQTWGSGNTILSTRVIPAGSFVSGVRVRLGQTGNFNTWFYIIDNATKTVLKKAVVGTVDGWIVAPFNFLCPSDCVFGFCGGYVKYRAEYASSPDLNQGDYVYSIGLNTGDKAYPDVGETITVTTTSANVVFSAPVELLISRSAVTSVSKGSVVERVDTLEKREEAFKEISFNGVSTLQKETETIRGVTYTWDGESCTVVGQATGGKSQYNMFISQDSFPFWLKPGTDYYIDIDAENVHICVFAYINGAIVNVADARTEPLFFTFPANAQGCIIDFEVNEGITANETVVPKIYRADFNTAITKTKIYEHPAIISFIDDDTGRYAPSVWGYIINQTGIRLGFACITGMISGQVEPHSDAYVQMTVQELQTLYENGNEVYSHSYSHPAFYEEDADTIAEECRKSKQWLEGNGFGRNADVIVYPGGLGSNKPDEQAAVRRFYRYGVDTFGGVSDEPIVNPYEVKRVNADTGTLAELKAYVDEAVTKNRHLVFMNHAYELNKDLANQEQKIIDLITYARNQGAIILPFAEAVRQIYGWA